eukprot:COSAG01_NODE_65091_length_274_cov_0.828571_1_plen_49_part_10
MWAWRRRDGTHRALAAGRLRALLRLGHLRQATAPLLRLTLQAHAASQAT